MKYPSSTDDGGIYCTRHASSSNDRVTPGVGFFGKGQPWPCRKVTEQRLSPLLKVRAGRRGCHLLSCIRRRRRKRWRNFDLIRRRSATGARARPRRRTHELARARAAAPTSSPAPAPPHPRARPRPRRRRTHVDCGALLWIGPRVWLHRPRAVLGSLLKQRRRHRPRAVLGSLLKEASNTSEA